MSELYALGGPPPMLETLQMDEAPNIVAQPEIFGRMLAEAGQLPDTTRYIQGPLIHNFMPIMEDVQLGLLAIDSSLTPEYLWPRSYQSPAVRDDRLHRFYDQEEELVAINTSRFTQTDLLVRAVLLKRLAGQELVEQLDIPPYCRQGESKWYGIGFSPDKFCANACFRMVFAGMTGMMLREEVVAKELEAAKGSTIVDDSEYHKLFKTDSFRELSGGKQVLTVDLLGADFSTIGAICQIRKRHGAQVYAVASVASDVGREIWHTHVLLGTTDKHVICHDPQKANGAERRHIPRDEFTRRWAGAYNRVQLFIAA